MKTLLLLPALFIFSLNAEAALTCQTKEAKLQAWSDSSNQAKVVVTTSKGTAQLVGTVHTFITRANEELSTFDLTDAKGKPATLRVSTHLSNSRNQMSPTASLTYGENKFYFPNCWALN